MCTTVCVHTLTCRTQIFLPVYFAHLHACYIHAGSVCKKVFAHVSCLSISTSLFSRFTLPCCSCTVTSRPIPTTTSLTTPSTSSCRTFPSWKRRTCATPHLHREVWLPDQIRCKNRWFTCARLMGVNHWSAQNDSRNIKKKPKQAQKKNSAKLQNTSKIKQVFDQECASSFERTSLWEGITVVHLRRERSCDKDDHQRLRSDDETRVPHPPSCSGLVIWQFKFGRKDSNKIRRIQKPTRRHSNKRQFHAWWVDHLLNLFNISHFSSTACTAAMAKRAQQESGEERATAKSRPMMNLTARMPSVSSSTSSNLGRDLVWMSRSWEICCGRRSIRETWETVTTRLFKRGLWSILVFSRVEKWGCCIFLTSWTTPNFPAATITTAILFFPQESDQKCRKDLRKALHLVHQPRKQKLVVSSRDTAYLWDKILRVTLIARRVQETLKCGPGKKEVQTPEVVLFSMPRETESMTQKKKKVSQKRKPRETESTCEKSFKIWKTDSDTMKASWKYRWTPRRCKFRYGRDLWSHRCRRHCSWTRVTKRIWKYSRILNVRTLKVCSELREWCSKEIHRHKHVFCADVASSRWKNPYCSMIKQ